MCKGFVLAHPELTFTESHKIISRKQKHNNVALISGGGSGHEPAHAGFVGTGMLDAAVCGDVFASPSQIQVYKALQHVATDKGVLMIIKNYSGDMMNFQNGAALAQEDGIKVDYVKVADDIAVKDSLYTVGRRGVAGTIFVHKIAGAAAVTGERSFGRGAVVGDKTLIDALAPCADSWSANTDKTFKENFVLGAEAAVKGAESTKDIVARMGRAGTVGDRSLGYPDAGAHGLGVIFTDIAEHIK